MATQKNFLTNEEAVALDRIATKSKMDCWFSIRTYGDGDFIYDLENDKPMALEDGIGQLTEGIVDGPEFYGLTYNEVLGLNYLFEILGLSFRFVEYGGREFDFKFTEYESFCRRVRRELEAYERDLLSQPADKIIYRSYQTVCKKEIVQVIENRPIPAEQIEVLIRNGGQNILEYLYDCYLDSDIETTTLYEDLIRDIISEGGEDE